MSSSCSEDCYDFPRRDWSSSDRKTLIPETPKGELEDCYKAGAGGEGDGKGKDTGLKEANEKRDKVH